MANYRDASSTTLMGLQPDSGNKNSHLRTLTRQCADREKTKYAREMHVHFKKTPDLTVWGFSICN